MIRETIVKTRNFPQLLLITLLEFIIPIQNLKLKFLECAFAQKLQRKICVWLAVTKRFVLEIS